MKIKVSHKDVEFAKNQIKEFKKIKQGYWRYQNVEAWRGIVCEMLTSNWLSNNFNVQKKAKGLDSTGIVDDCDMIINNYKVEIKSATRSYFRYLMPKIYDVNEKPKDFYIGVKYNETTIPNEIEILGFIKRCDITVSKYPIKQNKGAAYYEIPLTDLQPIHKNTFN